MQTELLNVIGVSAIFAFAIREYFAYIKTRKTNGNSDNSKVDISILQELQTMNSNHLHSIEAAIKDGNANLIHSIHEDNMKIIEVLGEIKGNLKR